MILELLQIRLNTEPKLHLKLFIFYFTGEEIYHEKPQYNCPSFHKIGWLLVLRTVLIFTFSYLQGRRTDETYLDYCDSGKTFIINLFIVICGDAVATCLITILLFNQTSGYERSCPGTIKTLEYMFFVRCGMWGFATPFLFVVRFCLLF